MSRLRNSFNLALCGCLLLMPGCSISCNFDPLKQMLARSMLNQGIYWENQGDFSHALTVLDWSIRMNPSSALGHYMRGIIYLDLKRYPEAIRGFSQAMECVVRQGKSAEMVERFANEVGFLYQFRGRAHTKIGSYTEALDDFNTALSIDRRFIAAWLGRGEVYFRLKNYPAAIADFSRVLEIENSSVAWQDRGMVYAESKQYGLAISDYSKALTLTPNHDGFLNRGVAHAKLGEEQQAIADFKQALRCNRQSAEAWYCLGVLYERNQMDQPALQAYQQYLKLTEDSPGHTKDSADEKQRLQVKQFIDRSSSSAREH